MSQTMKEVDAEMRQKLKESERRTPANVVLPAPVDCAEGDICYGCKTVIRGKAYTAGDRFFCETCAEDSDKGWMMFDTIMRFLAQILNEVHEDVHCWIKRIS